MTDITLNPVRYYTDQDTYHITIDNRPLLDLASNDDILRASLNTLSKQTIQTFDSFADAQAATSTLIAPCFCYIRHDETKGNLPQVYLYDGTQFIGNADAAASALLAQSAETNASQAATNASASQTAAAQSETNAAADASSAAASLTSAQSAATTAQNAATQAQTAIPPVQVADYPTLRAYTGAASVLQVTGYSASATPSGIGGTFVLDPTDTTSSDNGATTLVATNGKRWKRQYVGGVQAGWFGAKGDGVTDDTAPLQAAITFVKTNGRPLLLSAGTYLVTQSLDCTYPDIAHTTAVCIIGAGPKFTTIRANLTEAYPVLDYTNNRRGLLQGVTMSSLSTSQDTCALLLAETTATGANLITLQDCGISASPTAPVAVLGWSSDQLKCLRVAVTGGVDWGIQNYYGSTVTSKFRTIGAQSGDETYASFVECEFLAAGRAAFKYTGGGPASFIDCYFGVIGAGNATMFDFDSGGFSIPHVEMHNCRSENQSSATGVGVFNIINTMIGGSINGQFGTDAAGYTFVGPGAIQNLMFHAGISAPLFNNSGIMSNCTFDYVGGTSNIGTNPNAAKCWNLTFRGRGSYASILSVFGQSGGLEIYASNTSGTSPPSSQKWISTYTNLLFPDPNTPSNARPMAMLGGAVFGLSAYTGGSGLQPVGAFAFNPTPLTYTAASGYFAIPFSEVEFFTSIKSGVAAGSQLQISISQGANTLTLLNATALPAGVANCRISVRIMPISTTIWVIYTELSTGSGASPYLLSNSVTTTASTFTSSGGTLNFNWSISSATSNAFSNPVVTMKG